MRRRPLIPLVMAGMLLAACDILPDWLGEEEEKTLPGERITLEMKLGRAEADEALEGVGLAIPDMPVNAAWPQALGNVTGVSGNLALGEKINLVREARAGGGNAFTSPLVPPPVIADGMLFAMDGAGVISAHKLDNIEETLWSTAQLEVDEEENRLVGGGIAWGNGILYAAGSEGRLLALHARTGERRWQRDLLLPLRTSPRLAGAMLLLLTADNQLLALNRTSGELLWSHRGISEITAPLHAALPAARDGVVLVTYSSGELVALDQKSGTVLWEDTVASGSGDLRQQSHVTPLMARGLSFGAGPERIVAYETSSGRRIWERKVPARQAPWLAGNSLFLLTPNAQVAAIRGTDGGIHWVRDLPAEADGAPILWYGPVVAGGKVWIVGNHGVLLALSPQDGAELMQLDIPDDIMTTPVVADETLFLFSRDATLYALK